MADYVNWLDSFEEDYANQTFSESSDNSFSFDLYDDLFSEDVPQNASNASINMVQLVDDVLACSLNDADPSSINTGYPSEYRDTTKSDHRYSFYAGQSPPPKYRNTKKKNRHASVPTKTQDNEPTTHSVFQQKLFKTSLCKFYKDNEPCKFGEHCWFAHGLASMI